MNRPQRRLVSRFSGMILCSVLAASFGAATASDVPVTTVPHDGDVVAVQSWLVSGIFPSKTMRAPEQGGPRRDGYNFDFLTSLGGEAAARITPSTVVPLPDGSEVGFTLESWEKDYVDLTRIHGFADDVLVYLYAEVESPVAQDIYLHFGVNDAGKVWMNGELIVEHVVDGIAMKSMETAKVRLNPGRNTLLVKADQDGANWGVFLEFHGKTAHERVLALCTPEGVQRALEPFQRFQREIGDPTRLTGARRDAYALALFTVEHIIRDAGLDDDPSQWRPERFLVGAYSDRLGADVENARRGVDPYAGKTGLFEAVYLSDADLTAQPFTVYLPESYSPDRQYNLLVDLHGAGGTHERVGDWWGAISRVDSAFKETTIGLIPLGRGRWSQYEGLGEDDIVQTIRWVMSHYSIDPDRVYISGGSMGGGGTWKHAAWRPDLFAAAWSDCGWADNKILPNLLNLPTYVMHGDADWTVPVWHSRFGVRTMQQQGSPVVYNEFPGVDHGVGAPARANGLMTKLSAHRRVIDPSRIRISAEHPRHAAQYWGRIIEWTNPHETALVDARILDGNVINVTAENVDCVVLAPPERHLTATGDLVWFVDGQRIDTPRSTDGRYEIVIAHEEVSITPYVEGPKPAMRPYASGATMNLYTGEPYLIVYGTSSGDRKVREAIREMADVVSRFTRPSDDMEFGRAPVVADRDLTDEQAASRNLLLIGGASENRVSARLMAKMPIREENGALRSFDADPIPLDGRGYDFIYPNPEHPDRFVVVYGSAVPQFYTFRRLPNMTWDASNYSRNPDLEVWNVARVDSANEEKWNTLVHREFFTNGWRPMLLPDGRITRFAADKKEALERYNRSMLRATGADLVVGWPYPVGSLVSVDTTTVTWADISSAFGGGYAEIFDASGEMIVEMVRNGQNDFSVIYPAVDTTTIDRSISYRIVGNDVMWSLAHTFQYNPEQVEKINVRPVIEQFLREEYGVSEQDARKR